MITDGYWRLELFLRKNAIRFWCFIDRLFISQKNEHRISREFLFTAIAVRKIIEEEKEARKLYRQNQWVEPEFRIIRYRIPVWVLPFIGESREIGYKFLASDYDYEKSDYKQYNVDFVCNKIIHSSIWSVIYEDKKVYGVVFTSDREKTEESFVVTIDDWIKLLKYVSENAVV